MIRINLLPVEKRKTERTPVGRLALITLNGVALLVVALVGFIIWLKFNDVENDINAAQLQKQSLQPAVNEYNARLNERNRLTNKIQEINSVIRREPKDGFWYAVNSVWDVIHDHPRVWVDNITILDELEAQGAVRTAELSKEVKKPVPYGIQMNCHVASSEVSAMTEFREALKSHPIVQETLFHINYSVEWTKSEEANFEDQESLSFRISLFGPYKTPDRKKAGDETEPAPEEGPAEPPAPGAPAEAEGGTR